MQVEIINQKIAQLRNNEKATKALISELAFATVQRVHEHNDVTSLNHFIVALSPLNQKKVQQFAEKFTGHKMAEGVVAGRRKDFKRGEETVSPYTEAKRAFEELVESGMDFWQWAVMQNADKADKPVDLAKLQKAAAKLHKMLGEAQAAGIISTVGTVQLLLSGVTLTQGEVMAALAEMAKTKQVIDQMEDEAVAKALDAVAA